MKIQVRVRGIAEFARKLRDYPAAVAQAASGALFVEAEQSMTEMRPLVPVDEGILRASGHVQLPEVDGLRVVVRLGFGGPAGAGRGATNKGDVGYAERVHEGTTIWGTSPGGGTRTQSPRRFRRHRGGRRERTFVGQALYMSTVLDKRRAGFGSRLAARMLTKLRALTKPPKIPPTR